MDAAQWPQHQQVDVFSRPMEDIPIPLPNNTNNNNNNNPTNINNNNSRASTQVIVGDQRTRPQKDQNVNCPRCHSTNTKFCYYNNYSLTQPRYFCKTCRRYWTQGGSLRNVPVGGGSRKNKRSSPSISSTPSSTSISVVGNPTKIIPDLNPPNSLSHLINSSHQNPKFLQGQDLNLAFPIQGIFQQPNNNNNENHEPINIMNVNNGGNNNISTSSNTTNTCNTTTSNTPISALELLRSGIASRGSLNPYVPMPIMPDSNTLYPSGFHNLQDFKPNMNIFSHPGDHNNNMVGSGDNNVGGGGGGGGRGGGSGGARLLFPFADMNKLASTTPTSGGTTEIDNDQSKGGNHHQGPTPGYWSSGMLGGGTW